MSLVFRPRRKIVPAMPPLRLTVALGTRPSRSSVLSVLRRSMSWRSITVTGCVTAWSMVAGAGVAPSGCRRPSSAGRSALTWMAGSCGASAAAAGALMAAALSRPARARGESGK